MTCAIALKHITCEADKRFGRVLEIRSLDDYGAKLLILRNEPVFPDRPYMTITADNNPVRDIGAPLEKVAFFWGHYDLTLEQAQDIVRNGFYGKAA